MKIFFRVDASSEIGWGHAVRCIALADLYASRGATVGFVSACWPEPLRRLITARKVGFHFLPKSDEGWKSDAEATGLVIRREAVDWLVKDHYSLDRRWEEQIGSNATNLLIINDLPNEPHTCEVLLDQTLNRSPVEYANITSAKCMLLLGPKYALLRDQFLKTRSTALARRHSSEGVKRILVGLGGGDSQHILPVTLNGIASSGVDATVDVLVGTGYMGCAELLHEFNGKFKELNFLVGVEDVASAMVRADIAIGAAGTSSWERCALGLPTLIVTAAENQRQVAASLVQAGAGEDLGMWHELSSARISHAIARLAGDVHALSVMSRKASMICDGRGTDRVYLAVGQKRNTSNPGSVTLRLADTEDEQQIYEWQQDPRTRRFSRNPLVPTISEHHCWMESVLQDPKRLLMILEHALETAGVIRLDETEAPDTREVSIFIDPDKYGLGIASAGLKIVNDLFPSWTIVAEVLPSNEASHRLFHRAGYEKVTHTQYRRAQRLHV